MQHNADQTIFNTFSWLNEPSRYYFDDGLVIHTDPQTDFWQRTHYGFRNDNGHCLMNEVQGEFSFMAHFEFEPKNLYDQCGVMVRLDEENWIKASVEFENDSTSRLGSVVTNLGYSDWATTDISSDVKSMGYRISKRGDDLLIENSTDGVHWSQMRIAHLHRRPASLQVGVYACSPMNGSFQCRIDSIELTENKYFFKEK